MEGFAKRIAIDHKVSKGSRRSSFPLKGLSESFNYISKAYDILDESISLGVSIPPSGEWLLDNFYLIEEQVNSIKNELSFEQYKRLPSVNGVARILVLARELVSFTDACITEENVEVFIRAYQSRKNISMEELWLFPVMLKIAVIEYIREICKRIVASQLHKFKVESLFERLVVKKGVQRFHKYKGVSVDMEATAYVEHLIFLLKKLGRDGKPYLDILEEELARVGTNSSDIVKFEHYDLALRRVSMANSITSIRNIIRFNFTNVFENINSVESFLMQDKWYSRMDYDTRNEYREAIRNIARNADVSEIYVVSKLLELCSAGEHIGEFLIGDKRNLLYEKIGYRVKYRFNKLANYLICIYLPTVVFSVLLARDLFFLSLIPLSEIFVYVVNRVISKSVKPKRLPRLEIIPENVSTFVVVPTLLNSADRVRELVKSLEVYYLANKMDNLYFALLGDASESDSEYMDYDEEIANVGVEEVAALNEKCGKNLFFFLYRKRIFNDKQGKWLGYERKRGMITEFNNFLLTGDNGTFRVNTIKEHPYIKYVITLDADTELVLDAAHKLIGIMEHPLNRPVVENGIVVKGYGLVQPKVGISIESANATLFSKIFAGSGGIDVYSTAESNVYQDLFDEAIFTGKGIYNVEIFQSLLSKEIPENTVLSHDLLEGSYIRAGLASDVEVIDGFPARVNSYMLRLHRWTRGDWQIKRWIYRGPLNKLSRYKIFDNLRRSTVDIFLLLLLFFGFFGIPLLVIFAPFFIDLLDKVVNFKGGAKRERSRKYLPIISGIKGSFYRCFLCLMFLPYKAVLMFEAIVVTLYRTHISKRKMLEWVTAADAEKILGKDLKTFVREMCISPLIGVALVLTCFAFYTDAVGVGFALLLVWGLSPFIAYAISLPEKKGMVTITDKDREFLLDVARKTWSFFDTYMNEDNNFLIPDNFQEGRKNKVTLNTSATNLGLGLLAIVSAKDLNFISADEFLDRILNSLLSISKLEKWNGHLYNWYDVRTLKPIYPKFVSTVDSGNFVGYLYSARGALLVFDDERAKRAISIIDDIIFNMDFGKLYVESKNLFSIGYDEKEGRLVDSYYDLLASEARQASFVAICKRDVPYKHWFSLGRTLTSVDGYKGLVSWAGTMFEYFMPFIVMPSFKYTLLDETYEFCIYSQKKYARKLNVPWGISEAAFNLQDLNYNYQYKAFGIPWLGVKRGLKEEVVVSPYSSIQAISKDFNDVLKNMKRLKSVGGYDKFGFFDSIDYTPGRVSKNKKAVVKTYMAHHQGLILTSLNNFLNDDILKVRFSNNPQIKAFEILLQERVPENVVFTKEKKEKIKALKYEDYEDYSEMAIGVDDKTVNVLSNDNYTLVINNKGEGFAKWKDLMVTRYRDLDKQSSVIYLKDVATGVSWTNTLKPGVKNPDEYFVSFSPAVCKFSRSDNGVETVTRIAVSPEEDVEVRQIEIRNTNDSDVVLDVISFVEPLMVKKEDDISYPMFNNLFLTISKFQDACIVERKNRNKSDVKSFYINAAFMSKDSNFDLEINKANVVGVNRTLQNPIILEQDRAYMNDVLINTNTVISFKKTITVKAGERVKINFVYGIVSERDDIEIIYNKYSSFDNVERMFDLAISRSLIENRFLGYKMKSIAVFNELLSNVLEGSSTRNRYLKKIEGNVLKQKDLWKFGISGDFPMVLLKVKSVNECEIVLKLVEAIEYFYRKNILVDLVIVDEEKNSYEQYVWERIFEIIQLKNVLYLMNCNGGIHVVKVNNISDDEMNLLLSHSDVILDSHLGLLEEQIYEG